MGTQRTIDTIINLKKGDESGVKAVARVGDQATETANDFRKAERAAIDYGQQSRVAMEKVEAFGDSASSLRDVFGGVAALGGEAGMQLEQAAFFAADLLDAREGLTRAGTAIEGMVASSSLLSSVQAKVAATAAAANIGLEGTALSLTTVAAVAAPFVAIAGGMALAIHALTPDQAEIDRMNAAAQAARDLRDASLDMSSEQAAARRRELETQLADRRAELADLQAQQADLLGTTEAGLFTGLEQALAGTGEAATTLADQIRVLESDIEETEGALEAYKDDTVQHRIAINNEAQALLHAHEVRVQTSQDIIHMTEEAARREVEANRVRLRSLLETAGALQDLDDPAAADELDRVNEEITNLAERNEILTNTIIPLVSAREREEAAIEATTEAMEARLIAAREREQEAVTDLQEAVSGLVEERVAAVQAEIDAEDRLIAARKQEAKLQTDLAAISDRAAAARAQVVQAIADIPKQLAQNIIAVDRQYMKDELKRQTEFVKQKARIAEDAHDARLQRLQEGLDQMAQAEEDNDVIAFIRAQRATEQDVARMDSERDKEARRRAEDRAAEAAEARALREERVAQLQLEAKAAIATNQAKLAEINQQEQAALAARREAYATMLREQEAAEQRRLEVERRLEEARTGVIVQANREVVGAVVNLAAAGVNTITTQAANMVSSLNNIFARARAAATSTTARSSSTAGVGRTTRNEVLERRLLGRSFQEPAIATRPTPGIFGDRPDGLPEAVIPIPRNLASKFASGELFGGKQVIVNLNGDVGSGVDLAQLSVILNQFGQGVVEAIPA